MIQSVTILAFVEILERFAYYGLRAVMILFLTSTLNWSVDDAVAAYGLFTAIVLIGPLFAGLLSDLTSRPVLISIIGCVVFMLGACGLAFSSDHNSVQLFMVVVAIGSALYKPAIISALFRVSAPKKERFDLFYSIFYFCVNIGAFLGPLAIGLCVDNDDPERYRIGFMIAGAAMIIPIVLLSSFYKTLTINDKVYNTEPYTLTGNFVGTIILLFLTSIIFWLGFSFVQQLIVDYRLYEAAELSMAICTIIASVIIVPLSLFVRFRTAYKISGGMFLVVLLLFIVPVVGGFTGSLFILSLAEVLIAPMIFTHLIKTGAPRFTATLVGGMIFMSFLSNKLMTTLALERQDHAISQGLTFGFILLLCGVGIFLLDHFRPRNQEIR